MKNHTNKRAPGYQKERGERQQQRILAQLAKGPMSSYQLSDALHISRNCACKHVKVLMQKPNRRVRLAAFELNEGRPRHVFALGDKPDVNIHKFQRNRMLEAMKDFTKPASAHEIYNMAGLEPGSGKIYLSQLHSARRVYIAGWAWSNKTAYPLYEMGKGEDAQRPRKRPPIIQKVQAHRASIFASIGL